MNPSAKFRLSVVDLAELQPYLKHVEHDITAEIPEVIIPDCADILDLLSEIRYSIRGEFLQPVIRTFVEKVFAKALRLIFNRPITLFNDETIQAGVDALLRAYDDLDTRNDAHTEEERLAITDWDNGMIACAIIKACGRAAGQELIPA